MAKVVIEKNDPFRLVVMSNVFHTDLELHQQFDLKGSLSGRYTTEDRKMKTGKILKDLNFLGFDPKNYSLDPAESLRSVTIENYKSVRVGCYVQYFLGSRFVA